MLPPSLPPEEQLLRQRSWLQESWVWLLRTKVLSGPSTGRTTALDVGCGPGLVMELLAPHLDVRGVDRDGGAVRTGRSRGLDIIEASAEELPFEDGSFDVVYCSFLLLWVPDPVRVVREMARVSRRWIVCLAEPDYGGRISYPPELGYLDRSLVDGLRKDGADPLVGRKLPEVFHNSGLRPEAGIYSGTWSIDVLRNEGDAEWRSLLSSIGAAPDDPSVVRAKAAWDKALRDGTLVQYNPVFYTLAEKER